MFGARPYAPTGATVLRTWDSHRLVETRIKQQTECNGHKKRAYGPNNTNNLYLHQKKKNGKKKKNIKIVHQLFRSTTTDRLYSSTTKITHH